MDPIRVLIILALIGFGLWIANTYIPMADPFKTLVTIVTLIATVLWLLHGFGLFSLTGFH